MAAELITPTDELTGLPLPILPQEILPIDNPGYANRHHHWHPSNAPELDTTTLAGAALRRSRIQLVRADDHNNQCNGHPTYHDLFVGPPLPQTENEVFRLCVLACAGYIPEEAINLRGDQPKRVRMTVEEAGLLRKVGEVQNANDRKLLRLQRKAANAYESLIDPAMEPDEYVRQFIEDYQNASRRRAGFNFHHFSYGYDPLRAFFRDYVLSQELQVEINDVEEFLLTSDLERKQLLGSQLLDAAVETATDDRVHEVYRHARRRDKLHPLMPEDAKVFVLNALGTVPQRDELAVQLGITLKERLAPSA